MQPGSVYQVGKDHTGTLEKRNAIGIWSKKFVMLTGLKFSVCDSEGAAASQSFEMTNVIQAESSDPTLLSIKGATDSVVLRSDRTTIDQWYDLCRTALEVAGKLKPRNFGLPPIDPRYNLKFVDIPVEYRHRFVSLETAVIYWFAMTRKYGAASKITSKFAVEERVLFASDKAIYVTKPNSEVTRCMKIGMMKQLCTNLSTKKAGEELFMVIKMEAPDYDLYFAAPEIETLIPVLQTLFRAVTKGRELPVRAVSAPTDPAVGLQLVRPEGFTMAMVVPTTKGPLKKALDDYAAKHGLQLTTTGTAVKAAAKAKDASKAKPSDAPVAGPSGSASSGNAAATAASDSDLNKFLKAIGMLQLGDLLRKQMVDLDVLEVMDEDDFINFGIPAAQARVIKDRTSDADFMAAVRSGGVTDMPTSPTVTASQKPISLSDDDDDDLIVPVTRKTSVPPQAPAISFADLDLDDFDIEPTSNKSFQMKVVLDSDDDLDLPPPKPKVTSPPNKSATAVALELDDI